MNITQLNHVAIPVEDLERSVRFYEDVLDLRQIPRPNFSFPGAWFRLGVDQELHLICRGNEWEQPLWDRHFALRVSDAAGAEARLKDAGIAYRGPKQRPDGATQLFLRDPDGHVIELCTAPA